MARDFVLVKEFDQFVERLFSFIKGEQVIRSCKVYISASFTTFSFILKEGQLKKLAVTRIINLINIGSILNLLIFLILYGSANLYFDCVGFYSYVGIFGWIPTMHDRYFFDTISIKIRQGHWVIKVPGIAEKC